MLPETLTDRELAEVTGAPLAVVHRCRDEGVITEAGGRYPRISVFAVALVRAALSAFPAGSRAAYELGREWMPVFVEFLGDLKAIPEDATLMVEAGDLVWNIKLPLMPEFHRKVEAELRQKFHKPVASKSSK